MFWYGCPHCYRFEPELKKWLREDKPDNVEFIRIPAVFGRPIWKLHARAFYTAETLGVLEKTHQALFDAIHKEKQRMDSPAALRQFFVKHGVKGEDFDKTFTSFIVMSKLQRASTLSKAYQITGVPSLIINGKYVTSGPMANINNPSAHEHENLLKVVEYLIDKETAVMAAAK
jgi:thiol:disulfide interchange protein DsbA